METFKQIYGKANFTYLTSPDTQFGKNDYHVTLELSKEDAQEHIKIIQDIISKEVAEQHKLTPNQTTPLTRSPLPYKDLGDVVTFKIHSKFKPKIWNKKRKELGEDVAVWKDSTMWVNYKASGYNKSIGLGCTLYIQNIQIDELVQGSEGANGSCPFPERTEDVPFPEITDEVTA